MTLIFRYEDKTSKTYDYPLNIKAIADAGDPRKRLMPLYNMMISSLIIIFSIMNIFTYHSLFLAIILFVVGLGTFIYALKNPISNITAFSFEDIFFLNDMYINDQNKVKRLWEFADPKTSNNRNLSVKIPNGYKKISKHHQYYKVYNEVSKDKILDPFEMVDFLQAIYAEFEVKSNINMQDDIKNIIEANSELDISDSVKALSESSESLKDLKLTEELKGKKLQQDQLNIIEKELLK